MLEDGLTSILVDDDIKQLVIVDSAEQQELARKLRSQNRPFLIKDFEGAFNLVKKHRQGAHSGGHWTKGHGILQQLLHRRSVDDLAVVVHVLRLGLHIDSKLLKQEVYHQIERMADFSDGIFVLYGICEPLGRSSTISTAAFVRFSSSLATTGRRLRIASRSRLAGARRMQTCSA